MGTWQADAYRLTRAGAEINRLHPRAFQAGGAVEEQPVRRKVPVNERATPASPTPRRCHMRKPSSGEAAHRGRHRGRAKPWPLGHNPAVMAELAWHRGAFP